MTTPDANGWMPIETADKFCTIWLSDGFSMRLGFWMEGEEFENHGSKGGGWRDHANSENFKNGWDLHFTPTCWQPVPKPPIRLNPSIRIREDA